MMQQSLHRSASAQGGWGTAPCCGSSMRILIQSAAQPPQVVGTRRGRSSKRREEAGWAEGIAEKQGTQLSRLDKARDRLQNQLLNLDLDDDIDTAVRTHSNATANSSSSIGSRNGTKVRKHRNRPPGSDEFTLGTRVSRNPFRPVPPSPEVLVALLRRTEAKRALMHDLDVQSPRAVASRLLMLSSVLDLAPNRLVNMTHSCGRLLLRRPDQLQATLVALTDCLRPLMPPASLSQGAPERNGTQAYSHGRGRGASEAELQSGSGGNVRNGDGGSLEAPGPEAMARDMVSAAPELLLVAAQRLRRSGLELRAVCKARGVKVLPMLAVRPDLLLQSAASLAAKMDVLPGLLGLPPKRLREVLAARPDILRRSPQQLSQRYQLLGQLLGMPPDFLAELIAQEPGLLCLGTDMLRAKFESLAKQYGGFQDDVADMILVDPTVLIKAPVTLAAAAPPSTVAKRTRGSNDRLPVLDQLLQLSDASGLPMAAVLQLVVQDERVCGYSREGIVTQMAALATALGLNEGELRSRVEKHPRLLLLPADNIAGKVETLTRLLQLAPTPQQQPQDKLGSGGTNNKADTGKVPSSAVLSLLQGHPELLLQDLGQLHARLMQLSNLLFITAPPPPSPPSVLESSAAAAAAVVAGSPTPVDSAVSVVEAGGTTTVPVLPPQLLALLAVQPALLTAPPVETEEKLLMMQSLFKIPRALVLELISKEPALLAVSADDLERKFRALAASFGAFSSDAIDVVLADPSLFMRADFEFEWDTAAEATAQAPSLRRQSSWLPPPPEQQPKLSQSKQAGEGEGKPGRSSDISGGSATSAGSAEQQQQPQHRHVDAALQAAVAAQVGTREQQEEKHEADVRQQTLVPPPSQQQLNDYAADLLLFAAAGPVSVKDSGASSMDSTSGKGGKDMGLLGTMSAADFDRLGSEDLPPPPLSRRRRRLQQ